MLARRLPFAALILAACAASPPPWGVQSTTASHEPVVRGHVLDDEGRPLAKAWVRRMGRDGRVDAIVVADADGHFTMPVDPAAGMVRVHVSGLDRTSASFVVVTDELPVAVDVKLGTEDPLPTKIEDVEILVVPSFDDPIPMWSPRPVPGGLEVTEDLRDGSYPFLLVHTQHGKAFDFVGDGMVEIANGKGTVPVDVARPPPQRRSGSVTLSSGSASRAVSDLFARSTTAHHLAEADARPRVREAALVASFLDDEPASDARARADAVVASVSPTSAVWSIVSRDSRLLSLGHGRPLSPFDRIVHLVNASLDDPFVRGFVDGQPDVAMVSRFLHEEMLRATREPERQRRLVRESRAPRLSEAWLTKQIEALDPDRILYAGRPAPVLDVPALDGKGRAGSALFAGRPYLVEIWEPACGLCIYEQSLMHRVHRRFGKLGMLSIVVDDDGAWTETFRKDAAHPMPWKHGIVSRAEMAALFERLGAAPSFPFRFLVDAKGAVVDAWPPFRSASLEYAIERTVR